MADSGHGVQELHHRKETIRRRILIDLSLHKKSIGFLKSLISCAIAAWLWCCLNLWLPRPPRLQSATTPVSRAHKTNIRNRDAYSGPNPKAILMSFFILPPTGFLTDIFELSRECQVRYMSEAKARRLNPTRADIEWGVTSRTGRYAARTHKLGSGKSPLPARVLCRPAFHSESTGVQRKRIYGTPKFLPSPGVNRLLLCNPHHSIQLLIHTPPASRGTSRLFRVWSHQKSLKSRKITRRTETHSVHEKIALSVSHYLFPSRYS